MKIGILTYTREFANLGTNMQCYCTFKAVQHAFPTASVELVDYAATASVRRPYLSNISLRSVKDDCTRMQKYSRFFKEELRFSKESLTTTSVTRALDFIRRQRYDAIYVGSDTVLELKGARPDGLTPYWLDDTLPGVKVLAAASCNNVTFDALSGRQKYLIQQSLGSFSLLGVRDDATFRLLSHFTGDTDKRLQLIPDPTFAYKIDPTYIDAYFATRKLRLAAPIVCLHLLRDSTWAPTLAKYFRRAGYLIASLRPAYYADITFTDLSPFEQLGLYKHFALVITHRFHDTVFCLKNLTPVIAFPKRIADITPEGDSKIGTLLKEFGVECTNYIQNTKLLSAEYLFERHLTAISHFMDNGAKIQSALLEHRERYEAFMLRSRAFVR